MVTFAHIISALYILVNTFNQKLVSLRQSVSGFNILQFYCNILYITVKDCTINSKLMEHLRFLSNSLNLTL